MGSAMPGSISGLSGSSALEQYNNARTSITMARVNALRIHLQ